MRIFLDTSAYVKRYVEESGSDAVINLCEQAQELGLSVISVTESLSTLMRLQREKKITPQQYTQLKTSILEEITDISLCAITQSVIQSSIQILENNALKTLDSIQIACALEWNADRFVSADKQQIKAARRAGLQVMTV